MPIAIGTVIRRRRRSLGLVQHALAKRIGTHRPLVTRVECGARDVQLRTLEKYAAALGCSASDILREAEALCARPAPRVTPAVHHGEQLELLVSCAEN